jgi:hypothetical protein
MPRTRGVVLKNPLTFRISDEQRALLRERAEEVGAHTETELARDLLLETLQEPANYQRLLLREAVVIRHMVHTYLKGTLRQQDQPKYEEMCHDILARADEFVNEVLDQAVQKERVIRRQRHMRQGVSAS